MHKRKRDNSELYEWRPHKGLGGILFSFSEEQIKELLGVPTELRCDKYANQFSANTYEYKDVGIDVCFAYHEDGHEMSIASDTVLVEGVNLYHFSFRRLIAYLRMVFAHYNISLQQTEAVSNINIFKYKRTVINFEDFQEVQYDFPYLGATFWFENGQMTDISLELSDLFHNQEQLIIKASAALSH